MHPRSPLTHATPMPCHSTTAMPYIADNISLSEAIRRSHNHCQKLSQYARACTRGWVGGREQEVKPVPLVCSSVHRLSRSGRLLASRMPHLSNGQTT